MRKVIYVVLVAVLIALVVLSLGQMPFHQGGTAVHGTASSPVVTPTPTPEPTQAAVPEPSSEPVPAPNAEPSPEPAEESPEIPAEAPSEAAAEPAEAEAEETQVPAEEAAAAEAPAEAAEEESAEPAAEETAAPAAEEAVKPAAEETAKEEAAEPAETESAGEPAEEAAEPAAEDVPEESAAAAAEPSAEDPAAAEKAAAAFAEAEEAYAPVIEKYRSLYEDGLNSDRQYIWDNELSEIVAYSDGIGYALRDLDDNGIPELLVAGMETEEFSKSILYDLYTLADGTPVQVVSSQARARYYLLEDNTILYEGSGGAAYSYIFVNRLKGSELEKEQLLFTSMDGEDTGEYSVGCYYQLGESDELPSKKSVKISQEEFAALLEEMEAGICVPELTRIF